MKKTLKKKTPTPTPSKEPAKRGRPKVHGDRQGVTLRIPPHLVRELDAFAVVEEMPSRHDAIISILEKELSQNPVRRRRAKKAGAPAKTDGS